MGSHKAGSSDLSHLPPRLSYSLFPAPLCLNIERELSLPTPSVKKRQRGGGWLVVCVCVCVEVGGSGVSLPFHMRGGEERRGSAGSGLLVLSCERQTFGRVITRRTALGVISDSCLLEVFGAHSLYGLRLPPLRLLFRLHLHEEGSCTCQHKQGACVAQVCTLVCLSDARKFISLEYLRKGYCTMMVRQIIQ